MDRAIIVLGAPQRRSDLDLEETARRSMENAGFSSLHGQASTINNRPAWVGFYTGRLQDLGVVVVEAAHVVLGDHVYLVAGVPRRRITWRSSSGSLAGFWSIRVNDQWRIVFRWNDGSALDVRLTDYH